MRDFLWRYFSKTGEIDAYLLFKQQEALLLQTFDEGPAVDDERSEEAVEPFS